MSENLAIKEFVEEARDVSIEEAARRLDLKFSGKRDDHPQPCPACGGSDCFSFNTKKNAWNCRAGGIGGRDAIGMAAHCEELDVKRRDGFLEACSVVTGKPIPEGGESETAADRAIRKARIEARRLSAYEAMAAQQADQNDWREKERNKARGIIASARAIAGTAAAVYMARRGASGQAGEWLRFSDEQPYWHGMDEGGRPAMLWSGPALVAPFLGPDLLPIGCHITWIDLNAPPKFRPILFGRTQKGAEERFPEWRVDDPPPSDADIAAERYERLPTKKMRGSKMGGLIPLAGHPSARRWTGGEGIENGLAFARWEAFRDDTFYFAAGDLGNLAGPAEASSRFAHPTLKKADRNGKLRSVMVPGPVPRADSSPDEAMWIGDHVDELVLLGDGDSEPVMTAAAMARAKRRHARPGRMIFIAWPRAGSDFAAMAAEAAD